MTRRKSPNDWKSSLLLTALGSILILIVSVLELTVFGPKRLETERKARRDSPPKLVAPSMRKEEQGGSNERRVVTAFRKEEWRRRPKAENSSAD